MRSVASHVTPCLYFVYRPQDQVFNERRRRTGQAKAFIEQMDDIRTVANGSIGLCVKRTNEPCWKVGLWIVVWWSRSNLRPLPAASDGVLIMMTRFLPFFLVLTPSPVLLAQAEVPFRCGAGELHRVSTEVTNDPLLPERIAQANASLEEFTGTFIDDVSRGGGGYVVPIVFHIIHNNGPENISDAQILDAVRILNEDYNKENPDWDNVRAEFLGIVGDVGVQFRLATKDPSGNCTPGITRTVSALTNDGTSAMTALIHWPRDEYLNVWVAASADGAAGYTYRPPVAQWIPDQDGIVLLHNYIGSIGTGSAGRSRALTHEVGHWSNLAHTWGDSNDPGSASNCGQSDGVADTPTTVGWTNCNLNGASCGSPIDNVENYMEYSYCTKMFTAGQGVRMIAALNNSTAQRNELWQISNLINTGVNGNAPLCVAQFTSTTNVICAGGTIQFTDASYHDVSTWNWSFPGGEPATSTEPDPLVTYATAGTFPVSLSVSNGSSALSTTINELVVVAEDPGQAPPLSEGFENTGQVGDIGWAIANTDLDNTFSISNTAAFTGSKSLRIQNSTSMAGRNDDLFTPTLDMTAATDIALTFRYAYARRTSTDDDRLRVYVSNNCGDTWSLRKQLRGATDLVTSGTTTTSFVPTSGDQWGFAEITTISDAYHVANFRIRFNFESDGGNNLYIDDVNINGLPVGLEEASTYNSSALIVVPGPAIGNAQAVLNITSNGKVRVDLLDMLGRTVRGIHNGDLSPGLRRLDLPVGELPAGLYFVRMQQNGRSESVRFIVQ